MGIIVQKFGGSSVATTNHIKHVANRVISEVENGNQVVVVVSAMGKSTDLLLDMAKEISLKPTKRELDMLLSTGEQVTIALLTMTLQEAGYDAISFTGWQAGIETEAIHGNARILDIDDGRIRKALDEEKIVVVAGFQGITKNGEITTLGRGGSDTTAVALAAQLNAERCDIYTDVPGVFTSDPRYVVNARKLDAITYDEMLEFAHLGAGVLHPRAVEYAKNYRIPLYVRSSKEDTEGTLIWEEAKMEQNLIVRGVAFEKDISRITVSGIAKNEKALATIFTSLAEHNINVDIIVQSSTGITPESVSFSIKTDDLQEVRDVLEANQSNIQFDHLEWESGLAKVSIIGSGMISNPGVAAKMFSVLAKEGIFVKMVSTSEIKVSCVIDEVHMIKAANILHEAYELDQVVELTKSTS